MEDVQLNFVDAEPEDDAYLRTSRKEGRSSSQVLEERAERFKLLQEARRIFVSSATLDAAIRPKDAHIMKPYGGMYAKGLRDLRGEGGTVHVVAEGRTGHSVGPARAQQVAEALLERARRMEDGAKTPEAFVHVALLAHDARRLLSGGSLAMCLEALAIQQRMEVSAECAFIGTASKLEVKERFCALKAEIDAIVQTEIHRPHQINNALVEIADDLRQIYRDYDQFIEEEEAIKRLRSYEWRLKYLSPRPGASLYNLIRMPLAIFFAGIPELYFNHVVSALWKMGAWIAAWIFVFAWIFSGIGLEKVLFSCPETAAQWHIFPEWITHSAANFFAPVPGIVGDMFLTPNKIDLDLLTPKNLGNAYWSYWFTAIAEMMVSFVHIGIFVSYLFHKISRR
jgi:hypothetical protein